MADGADGTFFAVEAPARQFPAHLVKSEYIHRQADQAAILLVFMILLLIGAARNICARRGVCFKTA